MQGMRRNGHEAPGYYDQIAPIIQASIHLSVIILAITQLTALITEHVRNHSFQQDTKYRTTLNCPGELPTQFFTQTITSDDPTGNISAGHIRSSILNIYSDDEVSTAGCSFTEVNDRENWLVIYGLIAVNQK